MALNLAIHKATITDGGGIVTATQADLNGLGDEDQSTNVITLATNKTLIIHYDLGADYQLGQTRVYASIVDVVYWTIQVSNNNVDWTTKSAVSGGTYVYADTSGGHRYIKIICDTTGRSEILVREYEIDADATLMKYQAGSSDVIGSTLSPGAYFGDNVFGSHNSLFFIDTENPAAADGYLVGIKCWKNIYNWVGGIYILRDMGDNWKVVQAWKSSGVLSGVNAWVLDPPMKFKAGDYLGVRTWTTGSGWIKTPTNAVTGKSFSWLKFPPSYAVGDLILKSGLNIYANYELRTNVRSHEDLTSDYPNIPIPDRYLTGSAGASTNPRVVNLDIQGTDPEIDFYSVVSSLSAGIDDSQVTIAVHDASNFPQSDAASDYGGRGQIGTEKFDYDYIFGDTFTGCTRGVGGTIAAAHDAWDIVKDITEYIEISVDNVTWKKPGDAGLPLSLGATISAGGNKTFYVRNNLPFRYLENMQSYSRVAALWSV